MIKLRKSNARVFRTITKHLKTIIPINIHFNCKNYYPGHIVHILTKRKVSLIELSWNEQSELKWKDLYQTAVSDLCLFSDLKHHLILVLLACVSIITEYQLKFMD